MKIASDGWQPLSELFMSEVDGNSKVFKYPESKM